MTSDDFMKIALGFGAIGSPLVALVLGQLNLKQSRANGTVLGHVRTQTDGVMQRLEDKSVRLEDKSEELGVEKGKAVGLQQGRDEVKSPP
jgi:hypothetical protein